LKLFSIKGFKEWVPLSEITQQVKVIHHFQLALAQEYLGKDPPKTYVKKI
jgi:hypothetical protein